jgi:hypothetical protein
MQKTLAALVIGLATITATATSAAAATTTRTAKPALASHVVAIYGDDVSGDNTGGYVLYNNGLVHAIWAPFYGDAVGKATNFVAMAQESDGYWLITSTGKIFTFGSGCGSGEVLQGPSKFNAPIVGAIYPERGTLIGAFDIMSSKGTTYEFECNSPGGM